MNCYSCARHATFLCVSGSLACRCVIQRKSELRYRLLHSDARECARENGMEYNSNHVISKAVPVTEEEEEDKDAVPS
jgi:hypothetical protein